MYRFQVQINWDGSVRKDNRSRSGVAPDGNISVVNENDNMYSGGVKEPIK